MYFLKKKYSIHSISYGYLLGEIAILFLFFIILHKHELINMRFNFHFDQSIKNFLSVFSFQLLAALALSLNPIIDRIMASWLEVGSVSIIQYSHRLYFIPIALVNSIGNTI